RLRVLLVILVLVVAGLVGQRLHVFGSSASNTQSLSATEARAAEAELRLATAPASYRRTRCPSPHAICFQSKRPLVSRSAAAALALVRSFGLSLRDVAPFNCGGLPPVYRGRHLMGALYGCGGFASLGRFVAFFSVTSMNSDCRALRPHVNTQVQIGI